MKRLLYLSVLPLLAACNPINGTLNIKEAFDVIIIEEIKDEWCDEYDHESTCWPEYKEVKIKLNPGSFSAQLNFNSKTKFSFEYKNSDNNKVTVEMEVPKGVNIPQHSGSFSLKADQMKQSFDLSGEIDTEYSQSEIYRGSESCTYTRQERVCETKPKTDCKEVERGRGKDRGRDRDRNNCRPERVCENKTVTHYGKQDVEYHYDHETTIVEMDLLKPNSENISARFSGQRTESNKVYDYKGTCF